MAAHYMSARSEFGPSPAAIRRREQFASNPIWNKVFPNRYRDPLHSMDRSDEHLASGDPQAYVITHPSIEDVFHVAGMLFQHPEIAKRPVLVPTAIHQMWFMKLFAMPLFDIEAVPLVTEHSMKKKNYTKKEIIAYLRHYMRRLSYTFANKGVLVAAFQADQDNELKLPTKPVMRLIIDTADEVGADNLGITFMGLNILGRDIRNARSLAFRRYVYEITVGRSYTEKEFKEEAKHSGLTYDQLGYRELVPTVPPEYLSK
jgi:hypothetical protein